MGALPVVQSVVLVRLHEGGEEDPFGDLGAVDAGRGREGDRGRFVDGRVLEVVRAGGEDVDEICGRG